MAQNKVMVSIEAPGGMLCVDIFVRPDGSWGFEEYRRDPECGHGWYTIGGHAEQCYPSQPDARLAARKAVDWLQMVDAMPPETQP